jgi:hypothetical protein
MDAGGVTLGCDGTLSAPGSHRRTKVADKIAVLTRSMLTKTVARRR